MQGKRNVRRANPDIRDEKKGGHAEDPDRPWGSFTVLSDENDHKVKRLVVYPGKRMSLQRHRLRSEHWHVVCGTGLATLGKRQIRLGEGSSLDIPAGMIHRVKNVGKKNLVLVEVQRGKYFGDDDIERIEDDFGRA